MDIEKMTSDEFKAFCRSGNKNYFTRIRKMPLQDLLFTIRWTGTKQLEAGTTEYLLELRR